jgi:sterol desaturase/sphingolipid hydroxylase (fatty acid hydroxylase superfamily)
MSGAPLHSREIKTVAQARTALLRKRSPKIIAGVFALELALRALLGPPTWRDALAVAILAAAYPFGEWAIHIHLLHLRPFRFRGREVELATAKAHRQHHEAPNRLDMVLLDAGEIALLLLVAVPFVLGLGALGTWAISGDAPAAAPFVTGMLTGTVLVAIYEWTHFLIHTSYRPHSRFYRAIWRGHRLHHFKNEHYWHGITSTVADRVFGTAPDQRDVPRSRTARSLQDPL